MSLKKEFNLVSATPPKKNSSTHQYDNILKK